MKSRHFGIDTAIAMLFILIAIIVATIAVDKFSIAVAEDCNNNPEIESCKYWEHV